MDESEFVTHYVTNIDPPDDAPREPKGCWGWLLAIGGLLGWIVLYCLI